MKKKAAPRRAALHAAAALALSGPLGADPTPAVTDASRAVSVSALSDGPNLLVSFDRPGAGSAAFTVDLAALHPHLTSQDGSKTYALEPVANQDTESTLIAPLSGASQHVDLRFRRTGIPAGLYDLRVTWSDAILEKNGLPIPAEFEWGPLPLVSVPGNPDDELARVRRYYVGKIVYSASFIDGMRLLCTISSSHSVYAVDDPAPRVVSVERSHDVQSALVPNGNNLGDPRGVLALPPFQFTFSVLPDARMHRVMSDGAPLPVERAAGRDCSRIETVFSTSWHAYRTLRLTPTSVRAGHTPADRRALADGQPLIGMTHEQVAAIWGYPPDLMDVSTLDRLSLWVWPNPRDKRWADFTGDRAGSFDR